MREKPSDKHDAESKLPVGEATALLATGLLLVVFSNIKPWGATTAYLITFLFLGAAAGYLAVRRDPLLTRLLAACAVAGFAELYADWFIIEVVPTLTYAKEGPFIAASPLYMPFSWMIVLFLFSIVGAWLDRTRGLPAAVLGCLLLGACNLPVYEFFAAGAGWWSYHGVPAIGNAPLYLIVGEPLVIGSLPLLVRAVEKRGGLAVPAAGLALGAWIYAAFRIGLLFFGIPS